MNQVEPTDCPLCDWISIEDVLQQQDSTSVLTTASAATSAHQPAADAEAAASRSLTQRFAGLFKARPQDA